MWISVTSTGCAVSGGNQKNWDSILSVITLGCSGSHLLQQQAVRTDGLLHDGPGLDVVAVVRNVDQPHIFSLTLLPFLWVDAVLKNHFVCLTIRFGLEGFAVLLRRLDVRCGVHTSAPRSPIDHRGGSCIQELWLLAGATAMGQDDAKRAVHGLSVVGDGPGILSRPKPVVPIIILLYDPQGGTVPSAGSNILLITTQECVLAILEDNRGINRVSLLQILLLQNCF